MVQQQIGHRTPRQRSDNWYGFDRGFSLAMGRAGYLGMTWPKQYGGAERSFLDRLVEPVTGTEELPLFSALGRVLAKIPNLRLRELTEDDRLLLLRLRPAAP